jgi:hypothetical protein
MKKLTFLIAFCILTGVSGFAQSKTYVTTGGEMIFSFADITDNGQSAESTLRWAPVVNIQSMLNADISSNVGLFTGIAVRNVGYIYDNYTDPATDAVYKKKFRSYNLGIPVGIKIGNLDKMFIYGGYEVEFPFLYKEKTFDGGDKIDKITGWFSKREEPIQHGFLVGIQFPYGMNVKFKYYLSEFHNQDYIDGAGNKPYAGLNSQVFYFSLSYLMFRNLDFYSYE